jgi:hypothetical protein
LEQADRGRARLSDRDVERVEIDRAMNAADRLMDAHEETHRKLAK